jgi:Anti-sigma factor NepR
MSMQHSNPDGSATNMYLNEHISDLPDLDARTKGLLGRALQSHYDDLVKEPIPDRFLVLLAQLEAKEARDE